MPTKKRKLSFDIPADVDFGRDAGWVYRSDAAAAPETRAGATPNLSLALSAMVQMVTLTLAVATIPLTIGWRALGALADTGGRAKKGLAPPE